MPCEAFVFFFSLSLFCRTAGRRLSQPRPLSLSPLHSNKKNPSDPAAEDFAYPVAFDVRDLITVEDVMEELGLGPNG